jgi:H+/gluconate symporter-like permease
MSLISTREDIFVIRPVLSISRVLLVFRFSGSSYINQDRLRATCVAFNQPYINDPSNDSMVPSFSASFFIVVVPSIILMLSGVSSTAVESGHSFCAVSSTAGRGARPPGLPAADED